MTTTSLAIASRFAANDGDALGGTGLPLAEADGLADTGACDAVSLGEGDGDEVTTEVPSTFATKTLDDEVPFWEPTTTTCRLLGEDQMLVAATGTVTTVPVLSMGAQSVEPCGHTESTSEVSIFVVPAS